MVINIDVYKECNFKVTKKFCREIFELLLEYLKINSKATIEFSITFRHDIQELNKSERQIDKDTNVLTFALHDKINWNLPCICLGDIFFSYNTIMREIVEQNKTFNNHFTHLLIHSYLHLLGYDHIKPNEQKQMEKIEIQILNRKGIKNPYLIYSTSL
jgi:probable rRNA maturation factor